MPGFPPEVTEAIDRFIRELQTRIPVDRVILFGSYAHGTAIDESDIDIAVVSPAFGGNTWNDRRLLFDTVIAARLDSRLEPHPLSPHDYETPSGWVQTEILDRGIVIFARTSGGCTE